MSDDLDNDPDLEAKSVNEDKTSITLDDGQVVPVTNWMDAEGEECSPLDAVQLVGGPTREGKWLCVDLTCFEYDFPGEAGKDGWIARPPDLPEVIHINLDAATVMLSSGEVLRVTAWLDSEESPALSRSSAASLVTEQDSSGHSYHIDISPDILLAN